MSGILSDEEIDTHLDAVLRASGSALKHYSMHSTRQAMRAAMRAIERAVVERVAEPAPQPSAEPTVPATSVEWLLAQCEEYQRRAHEAEREVLALRAAMGIGGGR